MPDGDDLFTGQTVLPGYFIQEQAPFSVFSQQLETGHVAHVGECRLFGFTVTNTNAAAQFVLLFDTGLGAIPANGAVPTLPFRVPAATTLGFDFGSVGRWMLQGIVLVNSSTSATLTVGSADCWFDVQYAP